MSLQIIHNLIKKCLNWWQENKDIPHTMIATEKADFSVRPLMVARNKIVVCAEIMRMQV